MKKQTYSDFLATSETFNDWLKQIPFGFWIQSIKLQKDNSNLDSIIQLPRFSQDPD